MRRAWWLVFLVSLLVSGCSGVPTATPTRAPTATVPPALDEGVSIYLTDPAILPEKLDILSHIEMEDQPLLSMLDIVAYAQATHEMTVTAAGYERVHALSIPTYGRAFVVCVDGAPVYAGAFWAAYSSQSFSGVVIDPILVTPEHPVFQIRLGYPGESFFRGEDPRSDPRILGALEKAGKLR